MDRNELPLEPHHLAVPSGASKMISESMVRSSQTMHLSYTDTNTVSKWSKTRFHMTHVTKGFHQVRPKQFLSVWYVRRKLSTYLVPILALSLNRPNRASTWASSPRSSIGHVQNNLLAYGTLAQTMNPSSTDTNTISKWTKMRFHMTHVT